MFRAQDDGDGFVTILPPAPPPPVLAPAPLPPFVLPRPPDDRPPVSAPPVEPSPVQAPVASPVAMPAEARNANGETLAQAEAAVLAEVKAGALGADALARHPLPPGTSSAEALRFLASLPQTTYTTGQPGGTVTGPPIDTTNPPADPSVDLSGGGGDRELESAYKPPGVAAQWRNLVDVWKDGIPAQHAKVKHLGDSLLEVFK